MKILEKIDNYINEKTKLVCKDCGGNVMYNKKADEKLCTKCGSDNTKMIKIK